MVEYVTSAVNDVDLRKLSSKEREELAKGQSTPPDVLAKLAEDRDVRGSVAGNPSTTVGVLMKLAEDKDGSLRCRVAGNPNNRIGKVGRG